MAPKRIKMFVIINLNKCFNIRISSSYQLTWIWLVGCHKKKNIKKSELQERSKRKVLYHFTVFTVIRFFFTVLSIFILLFVSQSGLDWMQQFFLLHYDFSQKHFINSFHRFFIKRSVCMYHMYVLYTIRRFWDDQCHRSMRIKFKLFSRFCMKRIILHIFIMSLFHLIRKRLFQYLLKDFKMGLLNMFYKSLSKIYYK